MENTFNTQKKIVRVRSKKLYNKVDLTSMVSLAFMLVFFFMLTSAMSKPQAMNVGLPNDSGCCFGCCGRLDENRNLTILLGDNNKLVIYSGFIYFPISETKETYYGKNGIRKELLLQKAKVLEYSKSFGRSEKGLIVIIKPSKFSNYKNLVDIIDEMGIVGIQTYAIINDFLPEEKKLLE